MKLQRFNYRPKKDVKQNSKSLEEFQTSLENSSNDYNEFMNSLYKSTSKSATPWWVILLKVLAYAIGLVLAGYVTSDTVKTIFIH